MISISFLQWEKINKLYIYIFIVSVVFYFYAYSKNNKMNYIGNQNYY